jgi:hypothetical protein
VYPSSTDAIAMQASRDAASVLMTPVLYSTAKVLITRVLYSTARVMITRVLCSTARVLITRVLDSTAKVVRSAVPRGRCQLHRRSFGGGGGAKHDVQRQPHKNHKASLMPVRPPARPPYSRGTLAGTPRRTAWFAMGYSRSTLCAGPSIVAQCVFGCGCAGGRRARGNAG